MRLRLKWSDWTRFSPNNNTLFCCINERYCDDKRGARPRDFREAKEHHQNEEAFYDLFFFVFFIFVRSSARREIIVVNEHEDKEENEEGCVEHIYVSQ